MPELPEVQNTVDGINECVSRLTITDVWSDYDSSFYYGKNQIKDPTYFAYFKNNIIRKKIIRAERRAKHILIHLDSGVAIAVHMKMTGHFLYGKYYWNEITNKWQPESGFWDSSWSMSKEEVKKTMPLSDPFNDFIHVLFYLDNGMQLAFSDMRKFASMHLLENQQDISDIYNQYGPEPLDADMDYHTLYARVQTKPNKKIKTALLDQSLVAGYGNIYTDEALFAASIHPESIVKHIPKHRWKKLFTVSQEILQSAIEHGGDSMGDYRRIDGTGGTFHDMHTVYQKEKTPCGRCGSVIIKKQIDARVGRFCPACQTIYN